MKRQVAKIIHRGVYKVIFDDSTMNNPYTVYRISNGHTNKLIAYQDFASCMYYLSEVVKH